LCRLKLFKIVLTVFRRWHRSRPWRWCRAGGRARSWTSLGSGERSRRCTCQRWRKKQPSRSLRPEIVKKRKLIITQEVPNFNMHSFVLF